MVFRPVQIEDKDKYEEIFFKYGHKGCEYSFGNLILWGERNISFEDGHIALYSRFDGKWYYSFHFGDGDKKQLIDNIISDAKEKGIIPVITGLYEDEKAFLEQHYPDIFAVSTSRGSYDYVYAIDDLADLSGKKYHKKRNHLSQFKKACPDYKVQTITSDLIPKVSQMAEEWYAKRILEAPDADFEMERVALGRALKNYDALGMDGIVLTCGERIIAFTMASRMSKDTLDVHFEKAVTDINGVYAAVNYEFARYARVKYPDIKFLDREEDMGIEGLRKAKESYYPHHLVVKYRAQKI